MSIDRRLNSPLFVLVALAMTVGVSAAGATEMVFPAGPARDKIEINTENGNSVVTVSGDGYEQLQDAGQPVLPYRLIKVLLPPGESVDHYRFVFDGITVLAGGFLPAIAAPCVSDEKKTVINPFLAAWPADSAVLPSEAGRYLGTGYLHGSAIASFAVFPVAIEEGSLVLRESLVVEVVTSPSEEDHGIVRRERYREGFQEKVRNNLFSSVINPENASSFIHGPVGAEIKPGGFQPTSFPSLEGSPVDYVIITNDSLAAAYQALADWKTSKGVPAVIRTTEWIEANYRNGSDMPETIRNFIKDAYSKWGISYVLIGGDIEQVPVRNAFSCFYVNTGSSLPVDLYYSCLDGDWNSNHNELFGEMPSVYCFGDDSVDLYAEVYVGRLPSTSVADVDLLTAKIFDYESASNIGFTNRVLMLGEVLFPIGWVPGATIHLNGADLTEFVYLVKMTDPALDVVRLYETEENYTDATHEDYATAIDSLNAGFNHVIHVGHGFRFNMSVGDRSVMNTDADVMTNGDKLSNLYLLNCTAVAFNYFCLGEHFLLAPDGGGVSVAGASDSAFPNASSYYMYEYFDLLFQQGVTHIGEVFARSREPRTPYAILGDNVDLWTHYIYTLLADPEMPLWTGVVDTLSVSHVASVGLGTSSIQVTVNAGGGPVDSAVVCLSKGDDDYQYASTDGAGQVSFDFRAESAGEIRVVVTGRNHRRYDGTITVNGAPGAYISLNGMTVDDDATGGTSGNGDGIIDAGETVDLLLEMANSGGSSSGIVSLVLRTDNGAVTITDSTAAVGTVAAAGTSTAGDAVRVMFSSSMTDEEAAAFDLIIKENGTDTWGDEFSRVVHAPRLAQVTLRVDDTASGNGDGVVDAGESVDLYYGLKNFGTGTAYGLAASITDLNGAFLFADSTDTYADLGPMQESENSIGFSLIEPDVLTEHNLEITIVDAYGRAHVDTFELRPPDPPLFMEFDPGLGADRLSVEWLGSFSPDAYRYNVFASATPGGPYTQANADPVDHTVFLATGLAPSTRYYFVTTTIDVSGNESVQSAEFSASTNPNQMEGWPIQMDVATTSSPVLGDIDGDGDMEVVQGDSKVYAWHHNGVEMTDGDGDAQSWGVLSTQGDDFVSPIALARIDGSAGLDIIAASRNTREIFVFNYLGDVLPGWPQPVENYIRAAMVAGDISGEGIYEIVAVDELGVLYVWNANGTEYRDGDADPLTQGVFYRLPDCTFLYAAPAIADVDDDGVDEILAATQGGDLYIFNEDGSILPGFPLALTEGIGGSPAIGDLDDDGDLEVVVQLAGGRLRAYRMDGTLMWGKWYKNDKFFKPSPALGDLTGDGKLETVLPSADGKIYAVRYDGQIVSGWPVTYSDYTYTESSAIIADVNGDGNPDVVLGDETKLIRAWDAGGNLIDGFPLPVADAIRSTPALGDLDGDGDPELVAAGWDQIVYVWDLTGPYSPAASPWSNFHGNRHNDGTCGAVLPTGIHKVAFTAETHGGKVVLKWVPPAAAGYLFDISRAEVTGEPSAAPGEFGVLATDRSADAVGVLDFTDTGVAMGSRYVYRLTAATDGEPIHTSESIYVPVTVGSLSQNYPNPFNPTTRIEYMVPEGAAQRVQLVIYDVSGARVRTLVDRVVPGGRYTIDWDGGNNRGQRVGSGVYFYRLIEPNFTQTRKMLLLK
jgi:hypothetical protein